MFEDRTKTGVATADQARGRVEKAEIREMGKGQVIQALGSHEKNLK